MSYIGNTPTTQSFISGTDYFNGTGAQTAFTLSRTVASINDIQVTVNNVVQQPNSGYTISGTTLTFDQAPSAGTQNVYVRYLSTTTQAITPSQNTVSWNTLDSNIQQDLGVMFKNRIINGNMVIDQRNAGASVTPTSSAFITDRFNLVISQGSKITAGRNLNSVTPPTGFTNYLGAQSTSAYSVIASDNFIFQHGIEGFNVADLNWGTANAKTVTLSFWVRSSLTGAFGGSLFNGNTNRSYPFTYSISASNTWEQKSITIAGDTSGTWLTDNGAGIYVSISLGCGSTLSGTAGAWANGFFRSATGATSLVGTNGATFYLTGVQLEVGTQATAFSTAGGSYGAELALCQRYYEKNFNQTTAPQQGIGPSGQSYGGGLNAFSTSNARLPRIRFAVTKRTNPTITFFRPATAQGGTIDGFWSWYTAGGMWLSSTNTYVTDGVAQDNEFAVEMTSAGAFAVNASYLFGGMWTASAEL